ncbi:MAG: indolepyruvate oxidoreductase subunit beta family protein [Thermodesulfobacteriales bacterium]
MQKKSDLIKVLIPAVGGQGGGVLTEWVVQAFFLEDFDAQGISLPGLSQRGGSTVYYLEAHPKPESEDKSIIFAQFPVPGEIDIILAQEFLELGRALELGYGSDKTTIVTSTHRIYSTLEKMPIGSGIYSDENLRKLAAGFSSKFIEINALELSKANGMDELAVNAILLGALSASGAVPIDKRSFIRSIEMVGVAVNASLKAFEVGWEYAQMNYDPNIALSSKWSSFIEERANKLEDKEKKDYMARVSNIESEYPENLKEILAESVYRLIDYQDIDYAERYLNEVNSIKILDAETKGTNYLLTELFAKNLALLMSYEDGIRVAELKIKSDRFKRIREEMRVKDDQVFHVVDYLKPDAEEIYGLLPNILVAPVLSFTQSRLFKKIWWRKKPLTMGQTPVTNSFSGYMRLWMLTKIKFLRPYSFRYKKEYKLIKSYTEAINKYASYDYKVACLVAKSAQMVKGYGKVRRRTMNAFYRFVDNIISPLAAYESNNRKNFDITLEIGQEAYTLIAGETIEGIDKAEKLAQDVLEKRAA